MALSAMNSGIGKQLPRSCSLTAAPPVLPPPRMWARSSLRGEHEQELAMSRDVPRR